MESDRTHGLWRTTAPQPPELKPLKGDSQADVAVIGGGYTGLSAALHLAETGTRVVLLEAQGVGFGGAGRNVGLVNAGLWLMPEEVEKRVGTPHGKRLVDVLGQSPDLVYGLIQKHKIPCEAVRNGTLHCAHSRGAHRKLQQRESQWRERGAPVTLLDQQTAASMIGSNSFHGALLDKRAGTIQPLAYAFGLARAAQQASAILHDRSPVVACQRQANTWRITTPDGQVKAGFVILAVQGYADFAFKSHQREMIPFNFFQFATPPLPDKIRKTILPGGQGAWDTHKILSSYRLDADGRLIVGSVGELAGMAYRLHKRWSRQTLKAVFPQVGDTAFEHAWHGSIVMTPDHTPRFHIIDEGMATVTAYNGRGIGPGTLFGKLLAQYALTGSKDKIPLPVQSRKAVFLRGIRGLVYEAGARAYHFLPRR